MAKAPSPLLGYNTNVRHKGKVFHIQTEDSGVAKPHVITHLFADGGRILKTKRTSYADLVGAADLQVQVKKLMQDQHKAMFIALRDGQFDALLDAPAASTGLSGELQALADTKAGDGGADDGTIEVDESSFVEEPPPPPAPKPTIPPALAAVAHAAVQSAYKTPPPRSSLTPVAGLAPASGGRFVAPRAPTAAQPPQAAHTAAPSGAQAAPATSRDPGVFGERWVSERSLDEVILAYLAEELEEQDAT